MREKHLEGLISLCRTKTTDQLADLFTKSLPGLQHHTLFGKFGGILSTSSNLRGGVDIIR